MTAESVYQQYERLLRTIEATTREEGFEPPPRRRLGVSSATSTRLTKAGSSPVAFMPAMTQA
jgi:hypothetical protein